MSEHCMVIAGEWKSSADRLWHFEIYKEHMTRIVPIRVGIPLTELLSNVFKEFFENVDIICTAVLSYWPPNTKELATGLTIPPVMLTNDRAVSFFYQHFQANKGINLFVTFNSTRRSPQNTRVDASLLPFNTPNQPIKRTLSPFQASSSAPRHPATAGSQIPGFSLFKDGEVDLSQSDPPVPHRSCPPAQPRPFVQDLNCPLVPSRIYPTVHAGGCPPVQPTPSCPLGSASSRSNVDNHDQ